MYYKGTKSQCQTLLAKMDTKYGYPNYQDKTQTTSYILEETGVNYCLLYITDDYRQYLTTDENKKTISDLPDAFIWQE